MTLEEIEILRKNALIKHIFGIFLGIIVGGIAAYIALLAGLDLIGVIIINVGIIILSCRLVSNGAKRDFRENFKQKYVISQFESLFTDIKYDSQTGISESIINNTGTINMGDIFISNDYLSAKYKDVGFTQSDIVIKRRREININDWEIPIYKTLFMGRWMIFDFNKSFKANVQVRQNGFTNAKLKNSNKSDLKYKKIEMESGVFNKNFDVYAQNEHDAFYILTPQIMERIKMLVDRIDAKLIFCFIENKLHIGIKNNKDSFEHGIFKRVREQIVHEEVTKDVRLIAEFIDELKLNNDLFIINN